MFKRKKKEEFKPYAQPSKAIPLEVALHRSNWRRVAVCVAVVLGVASPLYIINKELPERAYLEVRHHQLTENRALWVDTAKEREQTIAAKDKQIKTLNELLKNETLSGIKEKEAHKVTLTKVDNLIYSDGEKTKEMERLKEELTKKPEPRIVYKDKVVYKDKIVYRDRPVEQLAKNERKLNNGFDSVKASVIDSRQVLINGVLYAKSNDHFWGAPSYVNKSGRKIGVYRSETTVTAVIMEHNKKYN